MKKYFAIICVILSVMFAGCKKKGSVSFCEGTDTNGKGVKCGTVAVSGDLTFLFDAVSAFGTDSVMVKIYNVNDGDTKSEKDIPVTVNPDEKKGRADIDMIDEGTFRVVVEKRGEVISEGTIEIVDSIDPGYPVKAQN